jgi:hypothetical protein
MFTIHNLLKIVLLVLFLAGCANSQSTKKLNALLNDQLKIMKRRVIEGGNCEDFESAYQALKVVRIYNSRIDESNKNTPLTVKFNNALHWNAFDPHVLDSMKIMGYVARIASAKDQEDALVEELHLFHVFEDVMHQSYYHFRTLKPLVFGHKNRLAVGEQDTIRFVVVGQSEGLRNAIRFGNLDSLENDAYWEKQPAFYEEIDLNQNGMLCAKFVLQGKQPGAYVLTGVIEKTDRGLDIRLPFRYHYIVK